MSQPLPEVAGHSAPLPGLRILVVDDHVGLAKIVAILLKNLGQQQVELAHSGREAIDKAWSFRPQVIILDLLLGDLSGLEVAQSLRRSAEFSDTLIVALSGNGSLANREETAAAGFDLHFEKPINLDGLREIIARCPSM